MFRLLPPAVWSLSYEIEKNRVRFRHYAQPSCVASLNKFLPVTAASGQLIEIGEPPEQIIGISKPLRNFISYSRGGLPVVEDYILQRRNNRNQFFSIPEGTDQRSCAINIQRAIIWREQSSVLPVRGHFSPANTVPRRYLFLHHQMFIDDSILYDDQLITDIRVIKNWSFSLPHSIIEVLILSRLLTLPVGIWFVWFQYGDQIKCSETTVDQEVRRSQAKPGSSSFLLDWLKLFVQLWRFERADRPFN